MAKVLLIEDDEEIRELVSYNLQKNGHVVIAHANANDALISLEDIVVDIILLDLQLPGLKGMEFLNILRAKKKFDNVPVVIISARNSETDIISALSKGADDYMPKPFSMEMLLAKVNSIIRRTANSSLSAKDANALNDISLDLERYKAFVGNEEIKLTNKEFELLKLFIQNPNKIFTRNMLLNSIWGYDSESLTRTVDSHVSNLRKKLGKSGDIIKSIPKIGYGIETK